jgi:hypothetical protein
MALAIPVIVIWLLLIWAGVVGAFTKTIKSRAKSKFFAD